MSAQILGMHCSVLIQVNVGKLCTDDMRTKISFQIYESICCHDRMIWCYDVMIPSRHIFMTKAAKLPNPILFSFFLYLISNSKSKSKMSTSGLQNSTNHPSTNMDSHWPHGGAVMTNFVFWWVFRKRLGLESKFSLISHSICISIQSIFWCKNAKSSNHFPKNCKASSRQLVYSWWYKSTTDNKRSYI